MENVFFSSSPMIVIMLTLLTVAFIVLGRQLELPQLPVIVVLYGLGLLIYHTVALNHAVNSVLTPYYFSIAFDLVILFLGFITYLWIDNIASENKDVKKYGGDSLSWFWDKL